MGRILGEILGILGRIYGDFFFFVELGEFGWILGPFWAILAQFFGILGQLRANSGQSGRILGDFGFILGDFRQNIPKGKRPRPSAPGR